MTPPRHTTGGVSATPEARAAVEEREWERAYELLSEQAASQALPGEDLRRLAEAAFWSGRHDDALRAFERAFVALTEAGDAAAAGAVALEIARERRSRLENALASAWFGRAEALLEQETDSVAYGHLLLARAAGAAGAGELDRADELGGQAAELGLRHGDPDLQALALHRRGSVELARGAVDEGLALIDQAMLAAVAGELSTFTTGAIYCGTISRCRDLADYRRAGEWTDAARRWCEAQSVTGFPGVCRVHRADIMRLRGAWSEAEAEARRACDELRAFGALDVMGEAFREIGQIRLRMGDLDAAEDAFRQTHRMGADPQPGLALLRLARGDAAAASAMLSRTLAEETWDRLARARLLPAVVEASLAAGDRAAAEAATAELESIVETYRSPAIGGEAAHARGAVLLDLGDAAGAAGSFRRALRLWRECDLPYETARTRVLLALAYRAMSDEESAALELEAARERFDELGALLDIERVDRLIADSRPAAAAEPARETLTFMFTDIVRSTALVAAMGDAAWSHLLGWHDETLRACMSEHGGREISHTGDGFFVGFDDAERAIACAVEIQRALDAHRREHGFAPDVRIGLHTAEAAQRGKDYGGRGVHEAARIAGLAGGGEILASRATVESGPARPVTAPRKVELKGFAEPVEVVTIDWRDPA